MTKQDLVATICWDEQGLIPVVVQDYHSKKVRMLAYMNEEALQLTLQTGTVYYYSRSRSKLWLKGETSGQYQYLKGLSLDCDGDTLLLQIEQVTGISCHTGNSTCFYRSLEEEEGLARVEAAITVDDSLYKGEGELYKLSQVVARREQFPKAGSYTNYLLEKGDNKILKKIGEECSEVILAAKDHEKGELVFEIADLMYHLTVLMHTQNVSWQEVEGELGKRK